MLRVDRILQSPSKRGSVRLPELALAVRGSQDAGSRNLRQAFLRYSVLIYLAEEMFWFGGGVDWFCLALAVICSILMHKPTGAQQGTTKPLAPRCANNGSEMSRTLMNAPMSGALC